MKPQGRLVAGGLSVLVILISVGTAWAMGPDRQQFSLFVIALMAVAMAVTSLIANPRELLATLVFAQVVLVAAAVEGSVGWLVAPLAVLLLAGAELNTLSWEFEGVWTKPEIFRARTTSLARLVGITLLASLIVYGAGRFTLLEGRVAVLAASVLLLSAALTILPLRPSGR